MEYQTIKENGNKVFGATHLQNSLDAAPNKLHDFVILVWRYSHENEENTFSRDHFHA
jgi:hypothetical protein